MRLRRRQPPRTSDAARLSTYPHPYPEGWYRLAGSDEVRRGAIRYIECLGRQFVVWREEHGDKVHAMPAFCPHLGANLSYGRVRGACIECPFHRWRFDGEGRVASIPYSRRRPAGVLTEPLPVQEVHGQIFAFHRSDAAERAGCGAPPYDVPRIAEVDDGRFVFRGHRDAGRVRMHIVEFAENSADTAHFTPVHGRMRVPWTRIPVPGVELEHTARSSLDRACPQRMYFLDSVVPRVFGRPVPWAGGRARVTFHGPASIVTFRFDIPGKGEIEMYQTHLPVGPLEQQVHFRWFADRRLSRLLVWYVIGTWISQWARDIEIWENKIYAQRPQLIADDGPVFRMRRWYRQFLPGERPAETESPPDRDGGFEDADSHRAMSTAERPPRDPPLR